MLHRLVFPFEKKFVLDFKIVNTFLKVPKHEIFILVDFRDFLTEHILWDSDLENNI